MLPVSLDCPFLIAPLVYLPHNYYQILIIFCLPLEYMLDNKVIVLGTNGGHGENHPTEDEGKYCEINYFYGNKFQEYVLES